MNCHGDLGKSESGLNWIAGIYSPTFSSLPSSLFVPMVNLEKIPSLGKTESSCIKLTAKPPAVSPSSPEPISPSEKPSMAPVLDSMPKTGAAEAADLSFPALVIQNGKGERSPALEEPVNNNRRNNHKVHRRIIGEY